MCISILILHLFALLRVHSKKYAQAAIIFVSNTPISSDDKNHEVLQVCEKV